MQVEDQLLLTSLRMRSGCAWEEGTNAGGELEDLAKRAADWDYVLKAAWGHGVTPLVYRSFQSLPVGAVPSDILLRLRQAFHKQGMMIHLQVNELLDVLDTFSQCDIPTITFKGPALAVQAYGHAALRKPGDFDLLIPKSDFARARSLLLSRGYKPHVPVDEEERYLETRGGSAFSRGAFQIDLHWTLEQRRFDSVPFAFKLPLDEVWRDAVDVPLGEGSIRTLSPEHHFLFVCFHGAKHSWQKLYLLCDVAQLIRSFPQMDWPGLVEAASRLRVTRILHLASDLAHRHLYAPLPIELRHAFGNHSQLARPSHRVGEWLFGHRSVDRDVHLFRMEMLESLPARISYVINRSLRKISKLEWSD